MDKVVLNNGTSLDVNSIKVLSNGLALTFTNQTVDDLKSLMTPSNLLEVKLQTSAGDTYGIYEKMNCLSINLMYSTNDVVVTLYIADTTQEQINILREQVAEMLLAIVDAGWM